MLWQAVSGFRFRMVAGTVYTAGPRGAPSLGGTSLDCVMQESALGAPAGRLLNTCTAEPVKAARSELDTLRVNVIIMGPQAYGTDPALTHPMEQWSCLLSLERPRSTTRAYCCGTTPEDYKALVVVVMGAGSQRACASMSPQALRA